MYMVQLLRPYAVLLIDPVNGGNADAVNSLEDYLVFNYLGLNFPLTDGIIGNHHIHQGSLLLSCEMSPFTSKGCLSVLQNFYLTITDIWSSITMEIQSVCTTTYICHSNKANHLFSLLKV